MKNANTWSSLISDSIGITRMETGLSYDMKLTGAVINDKSYGTIVSAKENPKTLRNTFSLYQNYPNPFNPTTRIKYSVPFVEMHRYASVQLRVYDILGREIATLVNEKKSPGEYEVQFNGTNLPSGVYFYRLQAGSFSDTKKLILLK